MQGYTEEEGRERAVRIFETLDKNGDGSLCENEFIKVSFGLLVETWRHNGRAACWTVSCWTCSMGLPVQAGTSWSRQTTEWFILQDITTLLCVLTHM